VYTHAHALTAQMGCLDVSPGVGMRHLEGPKNPDGLNLRTYIRICVQSTNVYVYTKRRDD